MGYYYLVWNLEIEKGGASYVSKRETIHIPLKSKETQRWGKIFFKNKWLHKENDLTYNNITSCVKIVQLKNLGRFLYTKQSK
jgi:hypothetical protein